MKTIPARNWIVFEGLDKAGKTTLAKGLVRALPNAVYCKGICSPTGIGRLTRRYPGTLLFLIELAGQAIRARAWRKLGKTVVQDRYLASVACHLPITGRFPHRLFVRIARRLFPCPPILVYCTVAKAVRIARIRQAGQAEGGLNRHEAWLLDHPEYIDIRDASYASWFRQSPSRCKIALDTTDSPIATSLDRIISSLARATNV